MPIGSLALPENNVTIAAAAANPFASLFPDVLLEHSG